MHRWNGGDEFPVVITLFSAPNYCDVYNNKAAIIQLENNTLNIKQYNYSAHPYILPNFMDIFSWSLPFVQEKVLEIIAHILKPSEADSKAEADTGHIRELHSAVKVTKAETMRNKVRAISSMMKMYKTLREEKELIMQLKGMCPDNKIPRGLLMEGKEAIANMVEDFRRAKKWDAVNEKRPDQQ
jgi:serine/threonine-protein phosphatase 2B catalytic subunit